MRSFAAIGVFALALSSIVTAQEPKISTIASIGMSREEGEANIRFIKLLTAPDAKPGCAYQKEWDYVLSLSDPVEKQWFQELNDAFLHKIPVRVYGAGDCSLLPGIESVKAIILGAPL